MGSTALWDFEGILIPRDLHVIFSLREDERPWERGWGGGWGEVQLVLSQLSASGLTEQV